MNCRMRAHTKSRIPIKRNTRWKRTKRIPRGPVNLFVRFISPNPKTTFNPVQRYPMISKTAFVSPFSSVIGDVTIQRNVYIAPNASIRADEGTPFFIGANTNIQDGVILHGLLHQQIPVRNKKYSIYIGQGVSIAHGALVHGPCVIGNRVFVGFKCIVFNAIVGEGAFIASNAVVTDGVRIPANRFVPPGATIDTQAKADSLPTVPKNRRAFAREVQRVNREFPSSYSMLFGKHRCSCGLACDVHLKSTIRKNGSTK